MKIQKAGIKRFQKAGKLKGQIKHKYSTSAIPLTGRGTVFSEISPFGSAHSHLTIALIEPINESAQAISVRSRYINIKSHVFKKKLTDREKLRRYCSFPHTPLLRFQLCQRRPPRQPNPKRPTRARRIMGDPVFIVGWGGVGGSISIEGPLRRTLVPVRGYGTRGSLDRGPD